MWTLDERWQTVNCVSVVPFPTENDFFVGFEVAQCKYAKC